MVKGNNDNRRGFVLESNWQEIKRRKKKQNQNHSPAPHSDQLSYSNLILKTWKYSVSRKIFFKSMLDKAFL